MQALRLYTRLFRTHTLLNPTRRCLTTASSSTHATNSLPWFIDPTDVAPTPGPSTFSRRPGSQQVAQPAMPLAPLPSAIASDSPIAALYAQLATSPHLEPGTLLVRAPVPTTTGPPLPDAAPKGRRKRGRTYAGEGVMGDGGGIWSWIVIAQVKEGTENRGAIESVIRIVRKSLLMAQPPLPLPPNRKRELHDGWAMMDAGEFAVHIVSKAAREKFFPERREW